MLDKCRQDHGGSPSDGAYLQLRPSDSSDAGVLEENVEDDAIGNDDIGQELSVSTQNLKVRNALHPQQPSNLCRSSRTVILCFMGLLPLFASPMALSFRHPASQISLRIPKPTTCCYSTMGRTLRTTLSWIGLVTFLLGSHSLAENMTSR